MRLVQHCTSRVVNDQIVVAEGHGHAYQPLDRAVHIVSECDSTATAVNSCEITDELGDMGRGKDIRIRIDSLETLWSAPTGYVANWERRIPCHCHRLCREVMTCPLRHA